MKITVVQLRKILLMAALGLTMSTIPAQAHTPVNLSQAAQIKTLQAQVAALQKTAINSSSVMALVPLVSVDPNPELGVRGPNIVFHGANLHIESGSGATDDHAGTYGTPSTGLGNLIIGYDEVTPAGSNYYTRTGSNNLIVGDYHQFNSYGGVIFGTSNRLSGGYAVVLGGSSNAALGFGSAIVAGVNNATGFYPLGTGNGDYCVILGGNQNTANGTVNVLVGGTNNETDDGGYESVILGGSHNYIGDNGVNTIGNYTQGQQSVITGGFQVREYGNYSVLLGGSGVTNCTNYTVVPIPTGP